MMYRFDEIELDVGRRELRVRGRERPVQPRVLDLLIYLIRQRDRMVPKEELLDALWPDMLVTDNSLQRAVSLARSAVREGTRTPVIKTVARQGYRFCGTLDSVCPKGAGEGESDRQEASALQRALGQAQAKGDISGIVQDLERRVGSATAAGRRAEAAWAAILLAHARFENREVAPARGWVARATVLLEGLPPAREHGFCSWLQARLALFEGDLETARRQSEEVRDLGRELREPDLEALGILYLGIVDLAVAKTRLAFRHIDEAGAIVMAGPTSPWVGGIVYCGIVWSCLNVADWSRASQWSEQFSHWCSRHGDLSYPGLCQLHRAELLCCQGSLREAEREARQAREILARSAPYAEGDAYRVLGDALLRQGRLAEAETAYAHSQACGWDPQPGRARLAVHKGFAKAAVQMLRRALAQPDWNTRQRRASLLTNLVSVALAAGDLSAARQALRELEETPELCITPTLQAETAMVRGEMAGQEGKRLTAIARFREALRGFQEVGARYEVALARLRLSEWLEKDGDLEAAKLERETAAALARDAGALGLEKACRQAGPKSKTASRRRASRIDERSGY